VAGRKSEVRAAFEAVILIAYADKEPAKIHVFAFSDELVLRRCHPPRHAWKVGQAADMVPMRMGQKNGMRGVPEGREPMEGSGFGRGEAENVRSNRASAMRTAVPAAKRNVRTRILFAEFD
jgi:hypothetical protein